MPNKTVTLSNDAVEAVFDAETGALCGFSNRRTGWRIQGRAELANSFSAVVPLPERLLNVADGMRQRATVRQEADALVWVWDRLSPAHSPALDIRLEARVTLVGSELAFAMTITNNSDRVLESIAYPVIGDLARPHDQGTLERAFVDYCNLTIAPLYPEFENERGYWGTEFPIAMTHAPTSAFNLVLSSEGQGLYLGCHDEMASEMVEFTFRLEPGYEAIGRVPSGPEFAGKPVRQQIRIEHFPFVRPGETITLSPIVLSPFEGDWHQGVDVYKRWRRTWMKQRENPDWVKQIHAWQQVQMSSWGDSLTYKYADLVQFGRDCAANGVGAIQLVGWTLYGQDGRLPIHDTDPRFGSRQELADAIAEIQAMGVKVVLYEKYSCADKTVPWYREELHKYASKDVFGNTHGHEGWRYDTPAHLAGINIRPYAWMCMSSTAWQDITLAQVETSLGLQPDGLLFDESQLHGSSGFCCFDPTHDHRPGAYNFGGDVVFEQRAVALLDRQEKRLLLSGEGCYDQQLRHYGLTYHRTEPNHIPVLRYIDPFVPMMNWAWGFDDRENLNFSLLYRYVISYEPRHFRGRLDEFPLTLAYGKAIDALRRRYPDLLWDATFRDTLGATVTVPSGPHRLYSVFEAADGQKAVIIANHGDDEIAATVSVEGYSGPLTVASPEAPLAKSFDGALTIPPRSVAVVLPGARVQS